MNDNFKSRKILKYHHVYWTIKEESLKFDRVLRLNLMSYLGTQDLEETKLIVWKLESFPKDLEDKIIKDFKFYIDNNMIELKLFNLTEFCTEDSILEKTGICKNKNKNFIHFKSASLSDFVRFVVLLKYGGFYTDDDTIYLRNFKPLWYMNFAYRWSFTEVLNTAVIGINDIDDIFLMKLMKKIMNDLNSINIMITSFHPLSVSSALSSLNRNSIFNSKSFRVLHSILFDPAWLCFDGIEKQFNPLYNCRFDEFTKTKFLDRKDFEPKQYFEGAFTYHMHLKYISFNVLNESYFDHFENFYKNLLKL